MPENLQATRILTRYVYLLRSEPFNTHLSAEAKMGEEKWGGCSKHERLLELSGMYAQQKEFVRACE